MKTSLGKRIKALREALRISQEELSQRLEMDRASLSLVENDKRSLKADELVLLSKALNISIDELLNLKSSTEVILEQAQKPKEKKAYALSKKITSDPVREKLKQMVKKIEIPELEQCYNF